MIFSNFFKAKWQHKNPNTRIMAIKEELLLDNDADRKTLSDLLNNDESELVRRAVLLKFNDFTTWVEAAGNNSVDKIKDYAQKEIKDILAAKHAIVLSTNEKLAYIEQVKDKALLEFWLANEQAGDVVVALCKKIDKPQILPNLFNQKKDPAVQHYIVDKTEDLSSLERLLKKAQLEEIKQKLNDKITALVTAAEKPVKLKKTTQLILSKLLSLKDVAAFEVMQEKKTSLLAQWQEVVVDFDCLVETEKEEFLAKYEKITGQLDKVFQAKLANYEQQQAEKALAQEKSTFTKEFKNDVEEITKDLANAIFNNEKIDEESYLTKIKQLSSEITDSVLEEAKKQPFLKALKQQQEKLSQLPIIAATVSEATQLIAKFSELSVPTSIEELPDKLPQFDDWKASWRKVEQSASGSLPETLVSAQKEIFQLWQQALKPLFAAKKRQFSQAQKKVSDVKRLIVSGKYNAAFGVYKNTEQLFNQLDADQQAKLQRDFDTVTEQMTELGELERFISTPRKQALIDEIQLIIDTPLDNPKAQATKVKEFRSRWNALGHAEDDETLNQRFNDCCEKAFAPCRLFFSEQDKLRAQHLTVRQTIVDNAKIVMAESQAETIDWKQLENRQNIVLRAWREAGEVDRDAYKALYLEFTQALAPVKLAISNNHKTNADAKQALIDKANKMSESEDVFAAIETVKGLQSQWKNIGYAGSKSENKLWQEFRSINDAIFAKRAEYLSAEKEQQSALKSSLEATLNEIKVKFSENDEVANNALDALLDELDDFVSTVHQNKPVIKSLLIGAEKLSNDIKTSLQQRKESESSKQWVSLFNLFEQLSTGEVSELEDASMFSELSPSWQKKITTVQKTAKTEDRQEKTIELEILAGVETPTEFLSQRLTIQVSLMQDQMLSGGNVDLVASLREWCDIGAFDQNDTALISRIKPLFVKS